jgi:membrane associated rhomboid family serine protease
VQVQISTPDGARAVRQHNREYRPGHGVRRLRSRDVIPLGDSLATRRQPVATAAIIGGCVLVFVYELTLRGVALDGFVARWGAVPRSVLAALSGEPRFALVTLVTSLFIHAGLVHLGGNMVFLWVFGRAVEDRLGSVLFIVFYLLAGAISGLVQCFVGTGDNAPLIGASGAIAGVLGIYFISYPTAWVRVLLPVLFFFWTFDLPALLVLAFWFVTQFFSGVSAITHASSATSDVAVWAHVAGFALGAASAPFLPHDRSVRPAGGGVGAMRRSDAPGPARLVSSLADLAALLLVARLGLRFFGLVAPRSPLAVLAVPVLAITDPVVAPFSDFLPVVRVLGGVLETYTLAAILTVYLIGGAVGQLFVRK